MPSGTSPSFLARTLHFFIHWLGRRRSFLVSAIPLEWLSSPCPVYPQPSEKQQGANQLPVNMANAVVKTYLMGPPESNDTLSCMSCHSFANGLQTNQPLDFSFALQEAYPIPINALRNQRRMLALKTGIKVPGIRRSGGALKKNP